MLSKKSVAALFLTVSLLVAPVTFAAPVAHTGLGWMSYVSAVFADMMDFFRFDRETAATDQRTIKPTVSNICGEHSGYPDPGGCT